MDAAERERFLETLRSDKAFRDEVRRELLTDELLELPHTVATLAGTVNVLVEAIADQRRDFSALAADVHRYMERTLTVVSDLAVGIRGEVGELRVEVGELRGEVGELRVEVGELRGEVGELRVGVGELRGEVGELRVGVGELRGEVGELKNAS
jgi:hypothetical protein